jgi:ubiquinone/menaquinone biosynthesis C-methylase UbiE
VTEDWDALAAGFDDEPDHGLRDPAVRDAWWAVLEPLLPSAPTTVADLACGTGSLTLLLTEHGHAVTGVDLAPSMVARAEAKLAGRARFVLGDVSAPPLPEGAFDVVLARHVLFALDDPEAVIARWVRLLRPGGRLVLIEGFWHTGSGLHAAEVRRILLTAREEAEVRRLDDDPALWGGPVTDERFLVLSTR